MRPPLPLVPSPLSPFTQPNMLKKHTLFEIRHLRESEDRVEFKKANQGLFSYNGSGKSKATDRRKCILGYVVAFCNEGGGELIFGVDDAYPHRIVGTQQSQDQLGQLESDIYRDVGIRTAVYELFEDEANRTGRVLVIHIPGRPKGKLYKFEDVPLMRVGEELKVMPDDVIRDILLENENDFSAEICPAATLDDLDAEAIEILKRKYAAKQRNTHFLTLDHTQILSDLGLIAGGQLTYAALILVGKASALARLLPQAKIVLEYRHDTNAIPYNNRTEYATCFFKTADRLWADINLRNDKIDISDGLYLLNLPLYNEEVVREAVNNAIAHRDYRCQSEIFVLQSPEQLIVKNAGGFPRGVNLQNLLSVCSTPRNRLLADVLAKTGVVERSGQGIDKIVKNTLSEGKKMPDYSHSDDFGVELHLSSEIEDVAFALFLEAMQKELPEEQRLSVFEIVALNQIREESHANLPADTLQSLLSKGMIERRGRTKGTHYVLSKVYYEYSGNEGLYSKHLRWNEKQAHICILGHFENFKRAKMKDFVTVLEPHMTRRQIRMLIDQLVTQNMLLRVGKGSATHYELHPDYEKQQKMQAQALEIGMAALQNQDERGKSTTDQNTDNVL